MGSSTKAKKMKGYEYFAQHFDAYGVTHFFQVPNILTYTSAEGGEKYGLKTVTTHHEIAAGYMADGYARATGRVGVCGCQHIGTSNLAAGLRDAYMACSPVLALSGGPFVDSHHTNKYQEIDGLLPFASVTKLNAYVDDVTRLPDMLRSAWRAATTGKPGPVHLSLQGHEGEEIDYGEAELECVFEERFKTNPAFRIPPDPGAVAAAAQLLAAAERPVIMAGGGTKTSGAGSELVALAERIQVPVLTAMNALECIPAGHPLAGGVLGVYGRDSASETVSLADLVVFVGSKTGSNATRNQVAPKPGIKCIQIDIDPEELGRNYPNTVSILGDAKLTLAALAEACAPAKHDEWVARMRQLDAEFEAVHADEFNSDAVPMRPERLCKELSKSLPSDALLLADTGQASWWSGMFLDLTSPDQSFLRANGSLGWAFPAALGAKMGIGNERPVIAFIGDGGFYYYMAELETALRTGTNIVVVLNDNASLGACVTFSDIYYDRVGVEGAGSIYDHLPVDFAAVAEQIGANSIRVEKPQDFAGAMEKALSNDRITVIHVRTDPEVRCPWDISNFQ